MKMRYLAGAWLAAAFMLVSGCGKNDFVSENEHKTQDKRQDQEQGQDVQTESLEDQDLGQLGDDNLFSSLDIYTWQEITVSIPDVWEGKYFVEESEDGFMFIQSASHEKLEGLGMLCGFYRMDGMPHDYAGTTTLAYTDTQVYYMVTPTDVNYYYEDEAIAAEYREMAELVDAVAATVSIDKEGVQMNPDEFVFPMSSTVLINREDISHCYSDNELRIARNEIYARHGLQFLDPYLANYFESCSWYEGAVSSEDFDDGQLSQIERDNIDTILKEEEAYQIEHPYPKEYQAGLSASEDLDGDENLEEIQCEFGENGVSLVIDGKEFRLGDYGLDLFEPVSEAFYVTDILADEKGLEIAILDEGPSDDPETHFFAYDGGLSYLGSVSGFPFKEQGGYNGFVSDGWVNGEIRMDFTHTCRVFDSYWYDYDNQKLEYQNSGYYRIVPENSHALSEDLTVYLDMDEDSLKTVLFAQEKTFFLETDGKEWVLVKGKDGVKGYLHIVDGKISGLSKTPQEVFSRLDFVD